MKSVFQLPYHRDLVVDYSKYFYTLGRSCECKKGSKVYKGERNRSKPVQLAFYGPKLFSRSPFYLAGGKSNKQWSQSDSHH
jgi:hypothetical protein